MLLRAILGGEALPAALTAPRVHHQRVPAVAELEGIVGGDGDGDACAPAPIPVFGAVPPRAWRTVCRLLRNRGHAVGTGPGAPVQAIVVGEGGHLVAASDPRKEGGAAAY